MFCSFMEDQILNIIESRLVITKEGNGLCQKMRKISEKKSQPLKFTCGISRGMVLFIIWTPWNSGLLLGFSRDKSRTKEYAITRNRLSCFLTARTISISRCLEQTIRWRREEQACARWTLKISKDAHNSLIIRLHRSIKMLVDLLGNKSKVRQRDG